MTLETLAIYATVLGAVGATVALAWSAVNYVQIKRAEIKHQEYRKFFEIMDHRGREGHSVASKMAAVFELRKYPEYSDVILRLTEKAQIAGDAAKMLKDELELTAEFLRNRKQRPEGMFATIRNRVSCRCGMVLCAVIRR